MDPRYPTYQFTDNGVDEDEGQDEDLRRPSVHSDSEEGEEEEEELVEQYLETTESEDASARERLAAALPHGMQQTYRILEQLMAPENHVHNWPFMNAVDPSGSLWDYAEVVTKPVWLKSVRDQLLHGQFETPTAVFRELRLMLRNCYRYNGPQHSVTRRGLRLEELMEQHISQLPPSLRDRCSLEATEGTDALVDPKVVNRRRSVRGKTPGYFSHVLHAVRHARADREKEFRRQQLEERRQQRQEKEQAIVAWEARLLQGGIGDRLRSAWELPQLAQFIHLSLRALNIFEVPLYEMERMLLVPQSSETLAMMMTSLVSSPLIRTKLGDLPPMPYGMWTEKLAARVQLWYRAFAKEAGRADRLLDTQGIEPAFWAVVGEQNPFDTKLFHQLSFYQRIWMVKTMCDYLFHHHKTVQECVMETSVEEPREAVLGRDRHGFQYIHFPQLYVQDVRLYRRRPWEDEDNLREPAPPASAALVAPPAPLRAAELGRWSRARLEKFRRRLTQLRIGAAAPRGGGGRGRRKHTCLQSGAATPAGSDSDSAAGADDDAADGTSDSSGDEAEEGPEFTLTRSGRKSQRPAKKARVAGGGAGATPGPGRKGRGRGSRTGTPAKPAQPTTPAAEPNICPFCGMSIRTDRARKAHRCFQEQQTPSARVPVPDSDSDSASEAAEPGSDSDSASEPAPPTPRTKARGRGGHSRLSSRALSAAAPTGVSSPSRRRTGRPRGRPPKRPQAQSRAERLRPESAGSGSEPDTTDAASRLSALDEEPLARRLSARAARASSRAALRTRDGSPAAESERGSRASSRAALRSRNGSPAGSEGGSRGDSPSEPAASPPVLQPEGLLPAGSDAADAAAEVAALPEAASDPPPTLAPVKAGTVTENGAAGDSGSVENDSGAAGAVKDRPAGSGADGRRGTEPEPAVNGAVCEGDTANGAATENGEVAPGGGRGACGDAAGPAAAPRLLEPVDGAADPSGTAGLSPADHGERTNGDTAASSPSATKEKSGTAAEKVAEVTAVKEEGSDVEMSELDNRADLSASNGSTPGSSGSAPSLDKFEGFERKQLSEDFSRSATDIKCEKMNAQDDMNCDPVNVKADLNMEYTDTKIKSEFSDTKPVTPSSEQKPSMKTELSEIIPSADSPEAGGAEGDSEDSSDDDDGPCAELNVPEPVPDPEGVAAADGERFQLVADTFEGLRRLIHTFDPDAEKKRPPCEVELHAALLKILRELEPLESKINQSVRRMRKRLCQEWLNYIERPADYRDPNEEAWRDPDEESDSAVKPSGRSPEPSPEPSGDEEALDAEGRRKQRSRRAKRKRVNYCVDGVPGERADPRDKDQEAWQVSSRGRMRKVRKMEDFAYEAESGEENSRSSAASSCQAMPRDPLELDGSRLGRGGVKKEEPGVWEEYRQQLLQREKLAAARAAPARPARITEPSPIWNSELSILNENLGDRVSRIRSQLKTMMGGRRPTTSVAGGTVVGGSSPLGPVRRTVLGPPRPIGQRLVVSKANLVAGALTKVVHTAGETSPLVLKMTKDGKVFMAKAEESDGSSTSAAAGAPTRADLPPTTTTSFGRIPSSSAVKTGTPPRSQAGRVSVVVPYKDAATGATMYMQLPPEQASSILASLNLPGVPTGQPGAATVTTVNALAVPVSSAAAVSAPPAPATQAGAQVQTVLQPQVAAASQPQVQVQPPALAPSQAAPVQEQSQEAAPPQPLTTTATSAAPQPGSVLLRHVQSLPIPVGGSANQKTVPQPPGALTAVPATALPAPVGALPPPVQLGSTLVSSDLAAKVKGVLQQAQAQNTPLDRLQAQRLAQRVMNDLRGATSSATTSSAAVSPAKSGQQQQPASAGTSPRRPQLIRPMPAAVRLGVAPLTPAAAGTPNLLLGQAVTTSHPRPVLAATPQAIIVSSPTALLAGTRQMVVASSQPALLSSQPQSLAHTVVNAQPLALVNSQATPMINAQSQIVFAAQAPKTAMTPLQTAPNLVPHAVLKTEPQLMMSSQPTSVIKAESQATIKVQSGVATNPPSQIANTSPQAAVQLSPQTKLSAQSHILSGQSPTVLRAQPQQPLTVQSSQQQQLQTLPTAGVILATPASTLASPSRGAGYRHAGQPVPHAAGSSPPTAAGERPTVLAGRAQSSPQNLVAGVPLRLTSPPLAAQLVRPGASSPRALPTVQVRGVVRPPPMQRAPRYLSTSVQFVSSAPTAVSAEPGVAAGPRLSAGPQQGKIVVIKNGNEQKLGVLMPDGQIMALTDKQVNSVKLGALKCARPQTGPDAAPS